MKPSAKCPTCGGFKRHHSEFLWDRHQIMWRRFKNVQRECTEAARAVTRARVNRMGKKGT